MSDLISRQAAIDAVRSYYDEQYALCDSIEELIEKLPSAEPEIIRCKNCIWFDRYTDGIEKYQWDGFCAEWARNTYENWYCGRAERR